MQSRILGTLFLMFSGAAMLTPSVLALAQEGGDGRGTPIADVAIILGSFVLLATVLIGRRFLKERTEQQRLSLLREMVEKGQPVPESVVNRILSDGQPEPAELPQRQVRNGVGFTVIGLGLLLRYAVSGNIEHQSSIVIGIVFLGLGLGYVASYWSKNKNHGPRG